MELRKWKESDAQNIAKYANNPNIARYLRNAFPNPYTIEDAERYIDRCLRDDQTRSCTRVIDVDGEAAGSIGVFLKEDVYCKSGELGYWLGEPFWRRGIMSQAIMQICNQVFSEYDIVRIFAEPFAHNVASRKVLVKNGFQLEGVLKKSIYKNGEFFDSCIYALLK